MAALEQQYNHDRDLKHDLIMACSHGLSLQPCLPQFGVNTPG